MKTPIKVLFASGSDDLIPTAIEHMRAIFPEIPLAVVSEFPPANEPGIRWIPYHLGRPLADNLALIRFTLRDHGVRLSAIILQPNMPYRRMRLAAFLLSPGNFLAFNEGFGHFMLRPQSAWTIVRHFAWRTRNLIVWETRPGGGLYTFVWRLFHPKAFRRPLWTLLAKLKRPTTSALPVPQPEQSPPRGISVVIPTRNGKHLLTRCLPPLVAQSPDEILVSDNGSTDGTADWLAAAYPQIRLLHSPTPLSFARAVNAGVQAARYSHVCFLNNDMVVEPGFLSALARAFEQVPDLFSATAQIFFPPNVRREETGKAVMPPAALRKPDDFPVTCLDPIPGEDLTYVLYGSGGCSLYDTAKLRALGGLDTIYEPAYVEDLDLGVRAWKLGWPTVFVASARVLHEHRATTSRYYTPEQLEAILELNYLRFVSRVMPELWTETIQRLNLLAARQEPHPAAVNALQQAWRLPLTRPVPSRIPLAIGTGEVAVFPGRARASKPVILIATPYIPFPLSHGGAVRMYNLMKRAAAEFDQVLVSFVENTNPPPPEILEICTEVVTVRRHGTHLKKATPRPDMVEEFNSPAFAAALQQTMRKWNPGVVQLEFTHMAQYLPRCAPAKTMLVEHDVTIDLHRQLLAGQEDWELRYQLDRWIPFETQAWRTADRVVTMSEKDRKMIEGGNAVVLPNGVDLDRFQPCPDPPEPGRLLFIGSFQHLPNVLAVDFFLREVWPRVSGLKLHIIAGNRHWYFLDYYRDKVELNLDRPDVEIEDFVPDVRPAYRRASIVIAPLLASAGTNIKIMEAMAMGKAVVATPGGVNGLDLDPNQDVLVRTSPAELAEAILELVNNPARRQQLEQQARATVLARYSWDSIASQQAALYRELVADSAAGS